MPGKDGLCNPSPIKRKTNGLGSKNRAQNLPGDFKLGKGKGLNDEGKRAYRRVALQEGETYKLGGGRKVQGKRLVQLLSLPSKGVGREDQGIFSTLLRGRLLRFIAKILTAPGKR